MALEVRQCMFGVAGDILVALAVLAGLRLVGHVGSRDRAFGHTYAVVNVPGWARAPAQGFWGPPRLQLSAEDEGCSEQRRTTTAAC